MNGNGAYEKRLDEKTKGIQSRHIIRLHMSHFKHIKTCCKFLNDVIGKDCQNVLPLVFNRSVTA